VPGFEVGTVEACVWRAASDGGLSLRGDLRVAVFVFEPDISFSLLKIGSSWLCLIICETAPNTISTGASLWAYSDPCDPPYSDSHSRPYSDHYFDLYSGLYKEFGSLFFLYNVTHAFLSTIISQYRSF